MEIRNPKQTGDKHGKQRLLSHGTRALAKAVGELVENGVIPSSDQTDIFGQACIFLSQAQQAATVLRSSKAAMINAGDDRTELPWDWFLLHKDERLRAGVIAINPYRPVPIHDHPGSSGLLLVLEGHMIEHHYQINNADEAVTGQVKLIPGQTQYLDAGQWSTYLPDWNNLHSLAAIGRVAIALSIQVLPGQELVRSWFLPKRDGKEGQIQAIRSHLGMLTNRTA